MDDTSMNTLIKSHLESLRHAESREMYMRTLHACEDRPGGLAITDLDMIFDLCCTEDMKQELRKDIADRGVMVEVRNGRQLFRKENPSLARAQRCSEYQRKLRADLRLTPLKRLGPEKDAPDNPEDEFDLL